MPWVPGNGQRELGARSWMGLFGTFVWNWKCILVGKQIIKMHFKIRPEIKSEIKSDRSLKSMHLSLGKEAPCHSTWLGKQHLGWIWSSNHPSVCAQVQLARVPGARLTLPHQTTQRNRKLPLITHTYFFLKDSNCQNQCGHEWGCFD